MCNSKVKGAYCSIIDAKDFIVKNNNKCWEYSSLRKVLLQHVLNSGLAPQQYINREWWCMPLILVHSSYSQENQKLKVILRYIQNFKPTWGTRESIIKTIKNSNELEKAVCYDPTLIYHRKLRATTK